MPQQNEWNWNTTKTKHSRGPLRTHTTGHTTAARVCPHLRTLQKRCALRLRYDEATGLYRSRKREMETTKIQKQKEMKRRTIFCCGFCSSKSAVSSTTDVLAPWKDVGILEVFARSHVASCEMSHFPRILKWLMYLIVVDKSVFAIRFSSSNCLGCENR